MTRRVILILAGIVFSMGIMAQRFYNLTAEEVKIDSLLPVFRHSQPLGYGYADSTYSVTIEYPEFIDMGRSDIDRLMAIGGDSVLPEMPAVQQSVSVSRKQGTLDLSFVPLVFRNGKYQKLVSFKLNIQAVAASRKRMTAAQAPSAAATRSGTATERYAAESVLSSGRWAKIRVPQSGIYQLTPELIRKAGFSSIDRVRVYGYGGLMQPEKLTGDYLKSTDDLQQVPLCKIGGRLLFYAKGTVEWTADYSRRRNPYSSHGYYFITESDSAALVLDSAAFANSFYPSDDFRYALHEKEEYSWFHGGRNLYESNVIGQEGATYTIASAGQSADGYMRLVLTSNAASSVTVSLNDKVVGIYSLDNPERYSKAGAFSKLVAVNNLLPSNKVTVKTDGKGEVRLDYILLANSSHAPMPNLHSDNFPSPEYVYRITNQNLHGHGAADMIIVIPATQKLRAQAERLKALHETLDSMTVRIIPADELFNEFSSGTPDASAYRRYMKMLYDRAADDSEMPRHLVLFGDAAWDNRMCSSAWKNYSPDDFLLCYESENSFSETDCYVTDDFFCLLDDEEQLQEQLSSSTVFRGKPDVAVGRFPVRNDAEAKIMVDKLLAYVSNEQAGDWQNTIVMMGDDGNGNTHMQQADDIGRMIESSYPGFNVKRVMWDAYSRAASSTGFSYPDAEKLISQYMTGGALVMNYSGHGSPNSISHEMVLRLDNFTSNVSSRLPLWLTASCDIMPFDGQQDNIGEAAVLNPKGGAIAFYGTTRTVYSHMNKAINMAFMRELLNTAGGRVAVGEAVRLAKNYLVNSSVDRTSNKLHYTLLGDPALKLAIPTCSVVIDSINGIKVGGDSAEALQFKAGMVARVSGHIESQGAVASHFNGKVTASVHDAQETIVCKLNNQSDDGASKAFTYSDHSKTIFKGADAVSGGRFSFSFAVPKDITYSDGRGMMTLYAISDDRQLTAKGVDKSFVLNGSAGLSTDSVGPSIYCYLNSSAFTNGDVVNSTPYFVAEITDEDGINSTGSGIGHDLMLIVDGDMSRTYRLNDCFAYDYGSYRSGSLGFSLPQLEPGPHRLLFRAWDILNNSSTAELFFNVAEGVRPRLFDIDCLNNPAVSSTSFRIVHDRAGSSLDIQLDILDMSGRLLWSHRESGVASGSATIVNWDLTVDSGSRLHTGVYLYRVRISSEGSSYASKAKKLIVISNK